MTHTLDPGARAPDMRRSRTTRPSATLATAVGALVLGVALVVPSAAWCVGVAWNVLEQHAHPRLLVLVTLPSFLLLIGALLCHGGFNRLRAAVHGLDRRRAA